jgi:hypothetical protein
MGRCPPYELLKVAAIILTHHPFELCEQLVPGSRDRRRALSLRAGWRDWPREGVPAFLHD